MAWHVLRYCKHLFISALLLPVVAIPGTHAEEPVLKGADGPSIPLWAGEIPHAKEGHDTEAPDLTPYLPPPGKATGAAIVVCPGGGYGHLALDHEGDQVGEWLRGEGIAAFILRYRHAPAYKHPVPLADVRRAIRTVRARASEWGIKPHRIGVLGFSAGGHLASTAATHFVAGDPAASDPIERVSSRPDFQVLVYPVITMTDPHTHAGSRRNLLGDEPGSELITKLSSEKQVTKSTPPAFLVHTTEDQAVPSENSILYYLALKEAMADAEMHVYLEGRHGFGLAPDDPVLLAWPRLCTDWLRAIGML